MARYIDADEAIEAIRILAEKHHADGDVEFANGVMKAVTRIKSQPTADVKEVVRGKWVQVCGDNKFVCSECGRRKPKTYAAMANYCGHCGTDCRGAGK